MANKNLDTDVEIATRLLNSFMDFVRCFYLERTGRKFELSYPPGRSSHYLDIADSLARVIRGETSRLIINVPPRYG
jgi:hypothetical protein